MVRNWGCVQEHLTVEHREFGLTVLVPLRKAPLLSLQIANTSEKLPVIWEFFSAAQHQVLQSSFQNMSHIFKQFQVSQQPATATIGR